MARFLVRSIQRGRARRRFGAKALSAVVEESKYSRQQFRRLPAKARHGDLAGPVLAPALLDQRARLGLVILKSETIEPVGAGAAGFLTDFRHYSP
jgi:hypothetical protein